MTRLSLFLLLIGAAVLPVSAARAQVSSGPDAGSEAEAFRVAVATGDKAGQEVNVLEERKDQPTVFLFVRAENWDRPMARFLRTLDQALAQGIEGADGAAALAVWLTDDTPKSKAYLPVAQRSLQLEKTTLSVFEGDKAGPNGWAINELAGLTAVVVRQGHVVASFGYVSLNETDVPEVVKAIRTPSQ